MQISVLKLYADLSEEIRTRLVNPGMPIPKAASEIHGITDDDVKDNRASAKSQNRSTTSLPIATSPATTPTSSTFLFLSKSLPGAASSFRLADAKLIDVCTIFKKKEERTLSAAMKFYCDEHTTMHTTPKPMSGQRSLCSRAQLERYKDIGKLPPSFTTTAAAARLWTTPASCAQMISGEIVFNFGKNKGKPVKGDLDYARWMLESDFPEGTKMVLRRILSENEAPRLR